MKTAFSFKEIGDVKLVVFGQSKIDTTRVIDLVFNFARGKGTSTKLLLDFEQVKVIEPAALRHLEAQTRSLEETGGQVRLLNINRIKSPQTAIQLAMICQVHDNEVQAVRSYR